MRDLQPYVGRTIEAKIIELDKNRNNVVLSRRAWLEETQKEQREDFLTNLKPGEVRSGVVSSVVNFGAFVDLGGMDGLIHVSELSWKHVDHPGSVVAVGDEVTVQVLDVDLDRERISLSLKATQQDPWQEFATSHRVGELVYGRVTKLVPFGSFVQVGEGIEGLVHISEMSAHHVDLPEQVVTPGEELWVKIIDLDLQRRRISLSIKQAAEGGVVAAEYQEHFGEHQYDTEGNYIGPALEHSEEAEEAWAEYFVESGTATAAPAAPRRMPRRPRPTPAEAAPAAEAEPEVAAAPEAAAAPASPSRSSSGPAGPSACAAPASAPPPGWASVPVSRARSASGRLADNSFLTHLATGRLIFHRRSRAHDRPVHVHRPRAPLGGPELAGLGCSTGWPTGPAGSAGCASLMGAARPSASSPSCGAWPAPPRAPRALRASARWCSGWAPSSGRDGPSSSACWPWALTVLAAEGELDPRWLLPIGWVWVNSHGSFPLGLAYLVVLALGRRLDREDRPPSSCAPLRWLVGGVAWAPSTRSAPACSSSRCSSSSGRTCSARHRVAGPARSTAVSERVFLLEVALAILAVARRPTYRARPHRRRVPRRRAARGPQRRRSPPSCWCRCWPPPGPTVGSLRSDARTLAGPRAGAVLGPRRRCVLVRVARLGSRPTSTSVPVPDPQPAFLQHTVSTSSAVRLAVARPGRQPPGAPARPGAAGVLRRPLRHVPGAGLGGRLRPHGGAPAVAGHPRPLRLDLVLWPKDAAADVDPRGVVHVAGAPRHDAGWTLLCRTGAQLSADARSLLAAAPAVPQTRTWDGRTRPTSVGRLGGQPSVLSSRRWRCRWS